MTREGMEAEVGRLLAKRAEYARLRLELPPQELLLLKRLLNRLRWINVKLARKKPNNHPSADPSIWYGWIDPNGSYHDLDVLGGQHHGQWAQSNFPELKQTDTAGAVQSLKERGWIRVTRPGHADVSRITPDMIDRLQDYYMKLPSMPFRVTDDHSHGAVRGDSHQELFDNLDHQSRMKLQRRNAILRRLARAAGVKRYAENEPVPPTSPSGPLAPWRAPQAPKPAPKIGTALKSIQDTSLAIPVSNDPFPVKRNTNVSVPTRSFAFGFSTLDREVDNRRPGGFNLGTSRGRQDFLDYLNETGEDSDFQHRLNEEINYQAYEAYEPDFDQSQLREIAANENWTPKTILDTLREQHPEASEAVDQWHRYNSYRPITAETPSLFDPMEYGGTRTSRNDWEDELADPNSTEMEDSLARHFRTHHPNLDHRAINNTLNWLSRQRRSEMEDAIQRAEDSAREWYAQNMDTDDIEQSILEDMHQQMEDEGRWDDLPEDHDEENERTRQEIEEARAAGRSLSPYHQAWADANPQLVQATPPQLPAKPPEPAADEPKRNTWYRKPSGSKLVFDLSDGRTFEMDTSEHDINGVDIHNLTFNDNRGSYAQTGKGHAKEVFDKITPAIVRYMSHHKPAVLTFTAAETDSLAGQGKSRQKVYEKLVQTLARLDPDYAAGFTEDKSGTRAYFVFDRNRIDEVEKAVGSHIARNEDIRPLVMSRRQQVLHRLARRIGVRKYAKADSRHEAHPLVEGFPIETFLRHLANDPANHESIREMAKIALTGGKNRDASNVPTALWALHEAMHEHDHPKKDHYNLMSAADKIGLDAHTYRAAKEIHEDRERSRARPGNNAAGEWWENSPEAVLHMASSAYHVDKSRGSYAARTSQAVKDRIHARVKELLPGIDDSEIRASVKRHAYRANKVWRNQAATLTPEEEYEHFGKRDIGPLKPRNSNIPEGLVEAEKATRYNRLRRLLSRINSSKTGGLRKYKMVAGDFLQALQRIRSKDQQAIRHTTEQIAAKLGLKPASTVDALHNSPHYSVPGVAQAIYSNASPENIHAAAAWYGLTGNIPGMAVFHVRPDGPDMLHRFRMQGSGHDMLSKLDKAGITDRILIPHRKGFDLLIPDRGGVNRDRVRQFTQLQKTELQTSRGHFKTIGSSDQARAREMFRNAITTQEQGR